MIDTKEALRLIINELDRPEMKPDSLPFIGRLAREAYAPHRALSLVQTIAWMRVDGEEEDGQAYEQSIDDAFETLASLIRQAREITKAARGDDWGQTD